jgi:hypothetical protein
MFNDSSKPFADTFVPVNLVDQWHHVVQIYHCVSGSLTSPGGAIYTNEMQCWLDGVNTTNQYYTKTNVSVSLLQGFNIGTYRAASARWFNGSIDEVAMWQRALSTNEILELYTNGLAGRSSLTYAPPQILSLATNSAAGGYNLAWKGLTGHQYGIQVSTNLIDWSAPFISGFTASSTKPVITLSPTPGSGAFYDPGLTNGTQRFYRVVLQQ